jgi:hypothetical protein
MYMIRDRMAQGYLTVSAIALYPIPLNLPSVARNVMAWSGFPND